jgi:hypothetical protein
VKYRYETLDGRDVPPNAGIVHHNGRLLWVNKNGELPVRRVSTAERDDPPDVPTSQLVGREEPGLRRTSYTAAELLATDFPAPRYAVPGIVAEGLNFFAGAPKLGKSWLAMGLCISVAGGGRALGVLEVPRGEALYLALEDPPRRLKERLQLALSGAPAPEGLYFETEWPRLPDGGTERLRGWLDDHRDCRLVVIDVFAKVRPILRDRGDRYLADYTAVEPLKGLADEHRVAIVAQHHTRKATADDFLETVSGTHGLAAAADSVLVMRRSRGQADAELSVTGRDVTERDLALRFASEVGTWTLLGDAEEWVLSETRREILQALRRSAPMSPKQLAESLGRSHEAIKKALQRMAHADQIVAEAGVYKPVPRVPGVPEGDQRDGRDTLLQGESVERTSE